jgi:hypothetical protein
LRDERIWILVLVTGKYAILAGKIYDSEIKATIDQEESRRNKNGKVKRFKME